jgi:opacity protein-like surface antigen
VTRPARGLGLALVWALLATAEPALAFDPDETYQKGTVIFSLEAGGGSQQNLDGQDIQTGLDLWYAGVRASLLPFAPLGNGFFHGALEIGLEPIYQRYTDPVAAFFAGLGLVGRYHFLSFGRFVPYVEIAGAAGATDLKVSEIRSEFAFWVAGGVGASIFVTDSTAIYAGYRLVHMSNGNIERPNRGFEAHTALAGVSFFFR